MVGLGRFELPTSPLSGVRSNQLSYRPGVRQLWIEPPPFTRGTALSRIVSRTRLNMRERYAFLTIGVDRERKKEGLVQAHPSMPKQKRMVLGNITTKLNGL